MLRVLLASLLLVACHGPNDTKLKQYMTEVKQRLPKLVAPIPTFKKVSKLSYSRMLNVKSPFEPSHVARKKHASDKVSLRSYPLSALSFVGELKQETNVMALIRTPLGKVTSVRVGEHIGSGKARVVAIEAASLVIQVAKEDGGKLSIMHINRVTRGQKSNE